MRSHAYAPDPRDASEPIDWLAEFDSETDDDREPEPEPEPDLAMFPAEAVEEARQPEVPQEPLFRVLPAGPPTGPQERYGDYYGATRPDSPDSIDAILASLDRAVTRMPEYRTAVVAQVRRRRAVIAAMAAILVISTAATAGSLALRRWQRPPEKVADQQSVDTGSSAGAPSGGLFGTSTTAPAAPVVTGTTPPVSSAKPTPKPTPTVTPTRTPAKDAAPPARTQSSAVPERIATIASNPAPPLANRPVTLDASPAATPTSSPTPTPTTTPVRTSAPTSTPTPTATPTPTPAPPPSPEAIETAAIQGVIDRYRRTFDSLSVEDVAAFWPSVNVRSLSRAFDQLASQRLTFEGCSIELRGTQADATCRGSVQFVPKVGSRTPRIEKRQWTFLLLRGERAWTITRVDVR